MTYILELRFPRGVAPSSRELERAIGTPPRTYRSDRVEEIYRLAFDTLDEAERARDAAWVRWTTVLTSIAKESRAS